MLSILLSTRVMMVQFLQETHKLFGHLRVCDEGQRAQVGEPNVGKSQRPRISEASNLIGLKCHRPQMSQASNLRVLKSESPQI